jgi:membrane metallo-endopeptidase-like protein 1
VYHQTVQQLHGSGGEVKGDWFVILGVGVMFELQLNGVRTQGENIADNGGVKQAYLAYMKWQRSNAPEPKLPGLKYNPRQLFWLSAAQIWCSKHRPEAIALQVTVDAHSPAEFRVLGPFSNLEYFAKDYNCPLGSRMNPEHKCSVW